MDAPILPDATQFHVLPEEELERLELLAVAIATLIENAERLATAPQTAPERLAA